MEDNKWIERLLALAADKKELDKISNGNELIDFIYRVYDEMFDFGKNHDLVRVSKEETNFAMIIMNKRIAITRNINNESLNFYVNRDLRIETDSKEIGNVDVRSKVFECSDGNNTSMKLDRIVLEKIVADIFKPLIESELPSNFSF